MTSLDAVEPPDRSALPQKALFAFFVAQILSVTVLQKFGLPVGGDVMEIGVFTSLFGVAALALSRHLSIDPARLVLFCLFAATALGSQLFGGQVFSMNSVLLALALYSVMVLRFDVELSFYRRCMGFFLNVMLVVGGLVILQQLMQVCFGWRSWPDLDKLAPRFVLFPGYNYLQPVAYGSKFYKPNAFLFLEVSFVSQFCALALMIELLLFQRLARALFYIIVLVICFAGTGLLLLALCAPFLLTKLGPRMLISVVLIAIVAAGFAISIGWYGQVHQRFGEVGAHGSSAYYRFNVPFQVVAQAASDPHSIFSGHGAGSTGSGAEQSVQGFILAPFAKIIYEYGFLTFFMFYLFFTYCLFVAVPNKLIALALFLFYNLGGGGFVVPVYVVTCIALGTLFRIDPSERTVSAPWRPWAIGPPEERGLA